MKFKLDENLPACACGALAALGHDALCATETAYGRLGVVDEQRVRIR
jgi:hypothetical protein